jgi:hypothetical protein
MKKKNKNHIELKVVNQSTLRFLRKPVFLMYVLVVMSNCIEPFELNPDHDTTGIVVTGSITDADPVHVGLTRPAESVNRREFSIMPVIGATVILFDDQGNQEELVESKLVHGQFDGQTIGVVGRQYHIQVILEDGTKILSTPQLLKPAPSIDSVYYEAVDYYKKSSSGGLLLKLELDEKDTLNRYYKWKIGGTYVIYTHFNKDNRDPGLVCGLKPELDEPCYLSYVDNLHFVLGESISDQADIISKEIEFLQPNSKFRYGQSIEVRQYSMTEEAYDYWKKVDDQRTSVGSVFDPPPAQIRGNLTFEDDTEITVFGFFEVSAVTSKRFFIEPTDFPGLSDTSAIFLDAGVNGVCDPPFGFVGEWIPPDFCCDCALLTGSTREKPSYWP